MEMTKDKFTLVVLPLTSFAIFVSLLYHIAFWSRFGINIFQYMPVSELLISSVYPIAIVALLYLAITIIPFVCAPTIPQGGGSETTMGKFYNKYISFFFIAAIALAIFPLITDDTYRYRKTCSILSAVLFILLSRIQSLQKIIPNDKIRFISLLVLSALAIMPYGWGATDAIKIINGENYLTARFIDDATSYKYIGNVGGYQFVSTVDNKEIHVRRIAEWNSLILTPTNKANSATP